MPPGRMGGESAPEAAGGECAQATAGHETSQRGTQVGRVTHRKKMHLRRLNSRIATDSRNAAVSPGMLALDTSAPQNSGSSETVSEFHSTEIRSAATRHSPYHGVLEGRKTWGEWLTTTGGSVVSRVVRHLRATARGRPVALISLPPLLRFGVGGGRGSGEAAHCGIRG